MSALGGGPQKADDSDSTDKLRECDSDKGGEGVKKSEIFADVTCPLSPRRLGQTEEYSKSTQNEQMRHCILGALGQISVVSFNIPCPLPGDTRHHRLCCGLV